MEKDRIKENYILHGKGRNIKKLQNGILQFHSGFICQLRNILKIEFQKLN